MKKIFLGHIIFIIVLSNIVIPMPLPKAYIIQIHLENEIIRFDELSLNYSYLPNEKFQPSSGYLIELISINGETIYEKKFESIANDVKKTLGRKYEKKLVVGKVAKGKTDITLEFVRECKKLNIKVILFHDILNCIRPLLLTNSHLNPIIKTVQLTEVFEKNTCKTNL